MKLESILTLVTIGVVSKLNMTRQCIFVTLAFVLFCGGCHIVSTVEGEIFTNKLCQRTVGSLNRVIYIYKDMYIILVV